MPLPPLPPGMQIAPQGAGSTPYRARGVPRAACRAGTTLCLLCGLALGPALLPAQDGAPTWLLGRLAEDLADEPPALRADLARIALTEIAAAYAREAQQARTESRHSADRVKLARWSLEVQNLADEYAGLAAAITPETPLDIRNGPEGSLLLQVAGRLVVASIPRLNDQPAFERQVVTLFCARYRCEDLMEVSQLPAPAAGPVTRTTTLWSFSQDAGPTCSSPDGLEFMFRNTNDLGQKRETCTRVVTELDALARAIEREIAAGTRVDWQRLAIHTLDDGTQQVVLNGTGHSLRLSLPTLAPRPELLKGVRPWLAAKVNGTPYTLVITHAEQRMAPAW